MKKSEFNKLKPMLLSEVAKPFNSCDYLYELKFDGIRALIYINRDEIIIKSRNNIVLNDVYPELLDIKNITNDECILDGEIVLFDNNKPSFSKLLTRVRLKNKYKIKEMMEEDPVTFVCFDILYKNKSLINLPLIDRKEILNKFKDNDIFVKSIVFNDGINLFKLVKKEGLEGIVAKSKNSLYNYNKRVKEWIKIKNFQEDYYYICGYNLTKNNNLLSVILGEYKNNKYYFVGKMSYSDKNEYFNKIKEEKIIKNYLIGYNYKANFIKPLYKIKVNYIEKSAKGILRQPFINNDK